MNEVQINDTEKRLNDIDRFQPEDKQKVLKIKEEINLDDSHTLVTYGTNAQRNISEFADTILEQIKTKDTGEIGSVLNDLVVNIKEIDVDGIAPKEKNIFSKFFGSGQRKVKKFISQYESLSSNIETIIDQLDKSRMQLVKDITLLDNLYNKNLDYLKNLDMYIAAGFLKLKELRETKLTELENKAKETNDPVDSQKLQDFNQFLNRFEKKVHDLKISRMIAIQTAPQIRLIQNNNQALIQKIQSSILNTIPLWKNQIIIAITLFRQKKSYAMQKQVSDTTNDLLQKNSSMLKQSTVDIAKENERSIVDIDTLKKVNTDLISTIEETLKIQAEGRSKRIEAEKELSSLENNLKIKLQNIRDNKQVENQDNN